MMPPESLKRRVLEDARRRPVPTRPGRQTSAAAATMLAAGAMLAAYAATLALEELWAGRGLADAARAASSGLSVVLRLGTSAAGRPPASAAWLVGGTLAFACLATWLVLPSRRSMLSPPRGQLLVVAIGVPLLVGAWLLLWGTTYADPYVRFGWRCIALTGATAPWPFLALLHASRRLEPRYPQLTGAALGSAAGAWGAVMAEMWCPLTVGSHVLVGHVLPLVVLVGAGAAVGYRMFRVRRVRGP